MTDQHSQDQAKQEKINRAALAKQVKENPVYQAALMEIRASIYRSLEAIKKDRHYEIRLKDAHDTLQNLGRLETVIDRFFDIGKVVIDQQKRKAFF